MQNVGFELNQLSRASDYHSVFLTRAINREMVMLVRLYAHYASAPFLHKFAQALPSGYPGRYKFLATARSSD